MRNHKFRAYLRNEGTDECTWFVYTESNNAMGGVYACRFAYRTDAERIVKAMNAAWAAEGRLYEREEVAA